MTSWKIVARASKAQVEGALARQELAFDWPPAITLSAHEAAPDTPDEWVLEAWLAEKPRAADKRLVGGLFDEGPPELVAEKVPDEDWVTLSQQSVQPVLAGAFHVHTPDHPPLAKRGVRDFEIPASQAFGTGHHETTAGCLAMLTEIKRRGVRVRNLADIGSGTGLLAFAALDLWPSASAIASDNDPVCEDIVGYNAVRNAVPLGTGAGELAIVTAEGTDHSAIRRRAPFDLVIANILALPLIDLAPDFALACAGRGHVVLSGLLVSQEAQVRAAYRRAGFRLALRLTHGDWSILWLRKRR
ncbi:50S ribosomal protein L11 methyltransferase [Qipengyuania sp. JC766]|uniref:50S ribosomal protein L11 methyltransferase n=1 Tax=Qipengyuania sp. JC766 TaxID=3232139 RepID=UPI00345A7889